MLIILHCEDEGKHPPFKNLCLLQNNMVQEPWQKHKCLIYINVNLPSVDHILFLEICQITQIKKSSFILHLSKFLTTIVAHADLVKTENCEELLCWSNKSYNIVKINWMEGEKNSLRPSAWEYTLSGDKENKI